MPSALLAREVSKALATRVQKSGVVVWLDAAAAFTSVAPSIDVPKSTVLRYDGSTYALQHEAERFLSRDEFPTLVVYVPGLDTLHDTPLLELQAIGETYAEGLNSVARRALKNLGMSQARIDALLATPNLTAELVEQAAALEVGVPEPLRPIFGSASPDEILSRALEEDPAVDRAREAGLFPTLLGYLSQLLDLSPPPTLEPLWDRALLSEFAWDLKVAPPPIVAERASTDAVIRELSNRVLQRLRQKRHPLYRRHSERVAHQLGLEQLDFDALALGHIDTFSFEERRVLDAAERLALTGHAEQGRAIIAKRAGSFWLEENPQRKAAWETADLAIRLADSVSSAHAALPPVAAGPSQWVKHYLQSLASLDQLARDMHARSAVTEPGELDELLQRAQGLYLELQNAVAERFSAALSRDGFKALADLPRQTDTFKDRVEPLLGSGPVAYVLADALRYEMAQSLIALCDGGELEARLAALPTVTAIGMAALLPGADRGVELMASGNRLGLEVGGIPVFDKGGREQVFKNRLGNRVEVGELDELLPPLKSRRKPLPELLVGWWREIDDLGEAGARDFTEMLGRLARTVRELGDAGFSKVVVASDHGHVFTAVRGKEMQIDLPPGTAVEVQRRCWVGRGVEAHPDVVHFDAIDAGMGSDLQLAFPKGLGFFRVAGKPFFHGGISLHELLVPVVTFTFETKRPRKPGTKTKAGDERRFTLEKVAPPDEKGYVTVKALYEKSLFSETSAEVQVVGIENGRVVTRLVAAMGHRPGTEVIELRHGVEAYCTLAIQNPGAGSLSMEIRTKDGGRALSSKPLDLVYAITRESPPARPPIGGAASLTATQIALEIPGTAHPPVVDLGFVASEPEREVLKALAKYGSLTELVIGRTILKRKGAAFFMADLIDKLVQHSRPFVEKDPDEGDEGAVYRFHRERLGDP